jgi:predicted ATPase
VQEPTGAVDGCPGIPGPLRGRAAALADVELAATDAHQNKSTIMVIEGPPGIGKSRLLEDIVTRTSRAGSRAFHETPRDRERLTRLWPRVVAAAPVGRVCVCLDDVDLLESSAVAALRSAVSEVADAHVLWCLAMRPRGSGGGMHEAIATVLADHDDSVRRLTLGALSADATALLTRDVLGADADGVLRRLVDGTHGNPALLVDVLVGLQEEGRIYVADGLARVTGRHLPRRTTATVQRRLARMSPGAHRTVQVAAVLPERFSATSLANALSSPPSRIVADVDEAIRCDFLAEAGDLMGFRHRLVREGVRQLSPGGVTHDYVTSAATRHT